MPDAAWKREVISVVRFLKLFVTKPDRIFSKPKITILLIQLKNKDDLKVNEFSMF